MSGKDDTAEIVICTVCGGSFDRPPEDRRALPICRRCERHAEEEE